MSADAILPHPPAAAELLAEILGTEEVKEDPRAWIAVLPLLRFHRLEGLAFTRAGEARTRLPAEVRPSLGEASRRTALSTTLTLESARRARAVLADAGVASLLLKGAALVEAGVYASPAARRMDDADMVVRPGAANTAMEALQAGGWVPWSPWSPSRLAWLDSATLADPSAPPGLPVTLDLHWRAAYGGLRFGGGAAAGDGLIWRGKPAGPGLPDHGAHLLLVAEHLLKHLRFQAHLAAYADLTRLVHRVDDWDAVVGWGRGRPMAAGVAALLAAVRASLGAPVPAGIPEALARRRTVRVPPVLRPESLFGRERPVEGRIRGLMLRWRLLGGPAPVARDLLHAAFPGRAWLRARYEEQARTTPGRWIHYVADVARWLTGRARSPASPNQELLGPPD